MESKDCLNIFYTLKLFLMKFHVYYLSHHKDLTVTEEIVLSLKAMFKRILIGILLGLTYMNMEHCYDSDWIFANSSYFINGVNYQFPAICAFMA